jgi:hypothetical protein
MVNFVLKGAYVMILLLKYQYQSVFLVVAVID